MLPLSIGLGIGLDYWMNKRRNKEKIDIAREFIENLDRIRVEVDENEGQIAVWDNGHG